MRFAEQVLVHTPVWVWALFAFVIYQGITALRPREVPIWRLLIVPAVFIVWGASKLFAGAHGVWPLLAWAVAALLMAMLAFRLGPHRVAVDPANRQVIRSGSVVPLVRNIAIFLLQYTVAVMEAAHLQGHAAGYLIGCLVSGATAGYFLGWVAALLLHYRQALKATGRASPVLPGD